MHAATARDSAVKIVLHNLGTLGVHEVLENLKQDVVMQVTAAVVRQFLLKHPPKGVPDVFCFARTSPGTVYYEAPAHTNSGSASLGVQLGFASVLSNALCNIGRVRVFAAEHAAGDSTNGAMLQKLAAQLKQGDIAVVVGIERFTRLL
jgi:hypothetical protein